MQSRLKEIKEIIFKTCDKLGVSLNNVLLFGSRARGEADIRSDFDLILISKKTYERGDKFKIAKAVRVVLARMLIDADVIIKSEEEINKARNQIGSLVREAMKDGVLI